MLACCAHLRPLGNWLTVSVCNLRNFQSLVWVLKFDIYSFTFFSFLCLSYRLPLSLGLSQTLTIPIIQFTNQSPVAVTPPHATPHHTRPHSTAATSNWSKSIDYLIQLVNNSNQHCQVSKETELETNLWNFNYHDSWICYHIVVNT